MTPENDSRQDARPTIAITMGDPAGIGPELCLRALEEGAVRAECVPVVLGDLDVLQRVARACDLAPPAHAVTLDEWRELAASVGAATGTIDPRD